MDAILMRWRDIPSQIVVRQGRRRAKVVLSARFQNAIDRAAMRAKKRSADAYINEWARDPIRLEADDMALICRRLPTGWRTRSTRAIPTHGCWRSSAITVCRRVEGMYRMRQWSVRRARGLIALYRLWAKA